jgi:GT2 family glycosyltransferase
MVRREAIEQAGLLDEGYFMYCEEIDWSFRIRRAGWEIYAVPAAHVIHLGGKSTGQIRPQSLINLWRSRLRLFDCYYSPPQRFLARRLVRLGMHYRLRQIRRAFRKGSLSAPDYQALTSAYQTILSL